MLRGVIILTALAIAATGISPFGLFGLSSGADPLAELTLSIVTLIAIFTVLE